MEIRALSQMGLCHDYEGYLNLPIGVLEDARIVLAAAEEQAKHG